MGRAFVGFQSRGGNGAGPGHGFRRDNMQAEVLLLSDLNTALRRVTVRARVARVWEFHKDNQLAHVDIVFVDEQGNQMYGEIQAMHAEIFKEKLKEGNVCLIKDFFVNTTKNKYKVVEGNFMIKITPWSKVEVQQDVPEDYPRYVYSLTDFKLLPSMVGKTDSFIGLGEQMPALRLTSGNDDRYNAAYNRDDPESIDVAFLNSSDPNEFLGKNMKSTVTIMRLASEHWWFLSCQLCHKKAFQATNAFVCSNKRCNCTTATPRYKVRVIGADKTGEVEFVFFATVAEQIIGKRLEVVMRNARPSIDNNATHIDGSKENDINEMQTAAIVTESPKLNATGNNSNQEDHITSETEETTLTASKETPNDQTGHLTNTTTNTTKKNTKRLIPVSCANPLIQEQKFASQLAFLALDIRTPGQRCLLIRNDDGIVLVSRWTLFFSAAAPFKALYTISSGGTQFSHLPHTNDDNKNAWDFNVIDDRYGFLTLRRCGCECHHITLTRDTDRRLDSRGHRFMTSPCKLGRLSAVRNQQLGGGRHGCSYFGVLVVLAGGPSDGGNYGGHLGHGDHGVRLAQVGTRLLLSAIFGGPLVLEIPSGYRVGVAMAADGASPSCIQLQMGDGQ
ncbi:hypothetical protein D1007_19016 [Hordeum vulgare]|nr:hypothetical protein D1007_19016 [Hordeum vulgare]